MDRPRKMSAWRVFASRKCPACGRAKRPLHWICLKCRPLMVDEPIFNSTADACANHIRHAEMFVELARRKRRAYDAH